MASSGIKNVIGDFFLLITLSSTKYIGTHIFLFVRKIKVSVFARNN